MTTLKLLSGGLLFVSLIEVGVLSSPPAEADHWARSLGGPEDDVGHAIRPTSDGGFVISGTFGVPGGQAGCWVGKYDGLGKAEWQTVLDGPYNVDNPLFVESSDNGFLGVINHMAAPLFGPFSIVKLDSLGNLQWWQSWSRGELDWMIDLDCTADGAYVAAGLSTSRTGFQEILLVKFDSSGRIQWQKTYGGIGKGWWGRVETTADGGYVLAGWTESGGAGDWDVWLLRLGPLGGIVWQKAYGGLSADLALAVKVAGDGGFVVAGRTHSFGAGNGDFLVFRVDPSGDILWQRAYGGSLLDMALAVEPAAGGEWLVSGTTDSFGAGGGDILVLKVDDNGELVWQKTYGGPGRESVGGPAAAASGPDGGFLLTGTTASTGAGGEDLWLLKADSNGDIGASCAVVGTPAVSVMNINLVEVDTGGTVSDASLLPFDLPLAVMDPAIAGNEQCLAPSSGDEDEDEDEKSDGPAWNFLRRMRRGAFGLDRSRLPSVMSQ